LQGAGLAVWGLFRSNAEFRTLRFDSRIAMDAPTEAFEELRSKIFAADRQAIV
jgi:hypothetical protein